MGNKNKHNGSTFDDYLLQGLKDDDQQVFLHIKEALENPDIAEDHDCKYLIKAIHDVARARGKSELADKTGITRQGLHKILNGESIPSIENVMAILSAIGLKFSIQQISKVISTEAPANILDIAQYAVSLLPRGATYMQLQKIVFYAQAESLVHFKRPLFSEKIEAWAAGPVVRELFDAHRGLKYINDRKMGEAANLSAEQKTCVDWAIEKYGKMDGDTLSHLTHIEDPWRKARKGLAEGEHSDQEISIGSILKYYSNLPNYTELDERDE